MYNDYFGFQEAPFSIAPDPQFLYMSERHREALAHLLYGLKTAGGFVLLTGEVGTGKTTVCRCLLEQVPEDSEIAFVLNPKLTATELLATICDELRVAYPPGNLSNKLFIDALNVFLLEAHASGRKTVLIIDEAQNLSVAVLEQIRLLTNLETNKQKLLQVIMLGQPELKLLLEQPQLRQFAQRITARYHLEPLSKNEIKSYLQHRLAVAGVDRPLFSAAAIDRLYLYSQGVPRLLNLLCDRALLGAYVKEQNQVSPALVTEAAREVFGKKWRAPRTLYPTWQWVLVVGVVMLGSVLLTSVLLTSTYRDSRQKPAEAVKEKPLTPLPQSGNFEWNEPDDSDSDRVLAFQTLFKLWGLSYQSGMGTVRDQAENYGLRLLSRRGSLGLLRQLNRPVVLTLKSAQGRDYYANLTGLTGTTATLVIGQEVRAVPIIALSEQWYGEFHLLWQTPPEYKRAVKPGENNQIVQWLDRQMATINGRSPQPENAAVLAGQLLEEVQKFQAEVGLDADGIVGTYTLIHLNSRLSQLQPTLSAAPGG